MNLSNIKFVIQRLFKVKERAKNYLISRIVMNILSIEFEIKKEYKNVQVKKRNGLLTKNVIFNPRTHIKQTKKQTNVFIITIINKKQKSS